MSAKEIGISSADPDDIVELQELLGEGAYGAVYKAVYLKNGAEVAVKIIPADNNIKKELNIMIKSKSPYLVQLQECYFKDTEAWLLLDYCAGGSSSDIIEACQVTFTEDETREAMAWSLLGLNYLHSNRRLHRDVKAGNILLTSSGQAKLGDFGVSKEVSTLQDLTVIGTPYWMAPEVIQEVPYDGRADIWSLGITAIELVEGNPPLHKIHPMRALFMIPSKPPPRLKEPEKFSKHFRDFVEQILVKEPAERPTSKELLSHPFVRDTVDLIERNHGLQGTPHLRTLVQEHMEELDQFRRANFAERMQQEEEEEETFDNKKTMKAGGHGNTTPRAQQHFSGGGSSGSGRSSYESDRSTRRYVKDGDTAERGTNERCPSGGSCESSTGSCVRLDSCTINDQSESSTCEKSESLSPQRRRRTPARNAPRKANVLNSSLAAAARYFENSMDIKPSLIEVAEDPQVVAVKGRMADLDADYAARVNALMNDYQVQKRALEAELERLLSLTDSVAKRT